MTEHLKPFQYKPGQPSSNPSGRPKLTDSEIEMRKNFKQAFEMLGTKTMEEIQKIAADPKQPAPYAMQAKALAWFYKNGNPAIYREILDRTIGKVVQPVEMAVSAKDYESLTEEEIDRRISEAENRIKAIEGNKTISSGESEI